MPSTVQRVHYLLKTGHSPQRVAAAYARSFRQAIEKLTLTYEKCTYPAGQKGEMKAQIDAFTNAVKLEFQHAPEGSWQQKVAANDESGPARTSSRTS